MDLGLEGKIALIGGSSRGLGMAVAMALAKEGASVFLTARNAEGLEQAARVISWETGARVKTAPADLAQTDQAESVVREAEKAFGQVDILINNAGGPPTGSFLDFSDQDWEKSFRQNLMSAVAMTRLVLPGMKDRGWGRILNVTSIAVKQPLDGLILSNAIRAGVHGWAKSLANEVAPLGITVNNILPGYTLTERVRSLAQAAAKKNGVAVEEILAGWESTSPMKRLGRPDELAAMAVFLVSERAGYITGVSIPVDGGFIKGLL